jgi:hypothetical protein
MIDATHIRVRQHGGGRNLRQGGTPMPPELARTTWGWVSLTTPEQTLTMAEPERYAMRFSEGDRVAVRADCNRGAGSVVFPERTPADMANYVSTITMTR